MKMSFIISELIKKDKARYTKLVGKFMVLLPDFIDEFSEPVKTQDYDNLKSIAHRLKGAGGNFGYMQLTNLCIQMEEAIKENDVTQVNGLHQQLMDTRDQILKGWEQQD